jgi:hypothetical protein
MQRWKLLLIDWLEASLLCYLLYLCAHSSSMMGSWWFDSCFLELRCLLLSSDVCIYTLHAITMAPPSETEVTAENVATILQHDTKVKVAGVDADGVLRGKLMSKKKFLSIAEDGFGFCSVIFGWDMHDRTYFKELSISNKENGYRDLLAVPDLASFRRIPWEDDVPFFLISFLDPETREPISACPRSLLQTAVDKLAQSGYKAMAGGTHFMAVLLRAWHSANSYSRVRVLPIPRAARWIKHRAKLVSNSFVLKEQPRRIASFSYRGHVWI